LDDSDYKNIVLTSIFKGSDYGIDYKMKGQKTK